MGVFHLPDRSPNFLNILFELLYISVCNSHHQIQHSAAKPRETLFFPKWCNLLMILSYVLDVYFPHFFQRRFPLIKSEYFFHHLIKFGCMIILIVVRENNIILRSTMRKAAQDLQPLLSHCFSFLRNFVDLFSYCFWMYDRIANAEIKKWTIHQDNHWSWILKTNLIIF